MPNRFDLLVGDDTPSITTSVLFNHSHVHHPAPGDVVAMLSLTAPEVDVAVSRTPLNLVAALDISTSMSGPKIKIAKDSLVKLVEHLGPNDRLAIISFGTQVKTVFESDFMTGSNKTAAVTAVKAINVQGATNFSGAIMEAFATISKNEGRNGAVNRIILFTDGEPTEGVVNSNALLELYDRALDGTVSVSTFGYGRNYNTELLIEMSRRGGGGHYAVEDIEQCAAMFGMELGGLLSTYAQNLRVTVDMVGGAKFKGFIDTAYPIEGATLTLPDIYGGETKNVLVKMSLPPKSPSECGVAANVVEFRVQYDDLNQARRKSETAVGSVQYVTRTEDVTRIPDVRVQTQIDIHRAAETMNLARMWADKGQLQEAQELLLQLSREYSTFTGADDIRYAIGLNIANQAAALSNRQDYLSTRSRMMASSTSYSTRRAGGTAEDALWASQSQSSMSSSFERE